MDGRRAGRRGGLAPALLAALAALLLYAPTLRLPLIYDTLLHIRITKELTWATVWLPTSSFGFYRPLTFVPLLAIKALLGSYPAPLLHAMNVAQHGLNAFLVALLVWRLTGRRAHALAAGLLLAAYPFSYQAVAVYGHNVHPHIANLFLLSAHVYLTARAAGRSPRWWLLLGFLFLLALLSHESAVLLGPFLALLDWRVQGSGQLGADLRRQLSALRRPPLPYLRANAPWLLLTALGVVYLLGYQLLPISRAPQAAAVDGGALAPRLLYALQGLTYPLAAALKPSGLGAPLIIAGSSALLLWLVARAVRRPEARWPLFLGLCWWLAAVALVVIPLPTGYLLNGPRLFYLSSVGAAIFWPFVLDGPRSPRRAAGLLWSGVAALLVLGSAWFVRGRLAAYAELTAPVAVMIATMADRPVDEGVVLINLPQWVAPPTQVFPVGAEFVAMMGDYLFAAELVEENLRDAVVGRPVLAAPVADLQRDGGFGYAIHAPGSLGELTAARFPAGAAVFLTFYGQTGVSARYAGGLQPATADRPLATLGPYALQAARARDCAAGVLVELTLLPQAPPRATTSLFVQLLDGAGQLSGQADGPPLQLRPDLLPAGDALAIHDRRTLPGRGTRVLVGAYDFASGTRLAAESGGAPLADNAWVMEVMPCGAE